MLKEDSLFKSSNVSDEGKRASMFRANSIQGYSTRKYFKGDRHEKSNLSNRKIPE